MTATELISMIVSTAALITSLGSLWYQKRRMDLESKIYTRKYDRPERNLVQWSDRLHQPPPAHTSDNNIDVGLPYQAGAPLRTPELFYGRQGQISSVVNSVTGNTMASIFILGARKSGKTSLFYHLNQILNSDQFPQLVPVYLDAQVPIWGDKNFYTYLLREASVGLATRSKSSPPLPELPSEVEFETVRDFLKKASSKGWQFVFMLDEFENLMDNKQTSGENFFGSLRSLILVANISWIPASFRAVYMPGTTTSPFTNIIQETCYMGPLSNSEARLLISEPAARTGHAFDAEDVALILELAGRMPYSLQKASLILYKEYRANIGSQTARTKLRLTFREAMQPHYESQLLMLTPEEKNALFQLVLKKDVTEYNNTLSMLSNYGFIDKTTDGYKIPGTTFAEFLYQNAKDAGL